METVIKKEDPFWEELTAHVKELITDEKQRKQMERYFDLMMSYDLGEKGLTIFVADEMQVELDSQRYTKLLVASLAMMGYPYFEVTFKKAVEVPPHLNQPAHYEVTPSKKEEDTKNLQNGIFTPLNENYTFENFVQGPSNSFAHAAALGVAKRLGHVNPLFIYGGSGLGKTHLMEAIGFRVKQNFPNLSVCYVPCETFLNDFINSITNHMMDAFRERYRKIDLLLIDDVQFAAGKVEFQKEFFNTFNALADSQRQIVMTSDVPPRDMKNCEERLTSRFTQGMVVEIELPSYETRLAILKFKAAVRKLNVPENILQYIAENIRSHIRALEGALNCLETFQRMNPSYSLNMAIVQHLLKDSIEAEKALKEIKIDEIIRLVSDYYHVTKNDILSKDRTQALVTPRQVAMFLARKLTSRSLPEIASLFNKTHATVHHGMQTIQKRIDVEADLKASVNELVQKLGRTMSDCTV